MIAIYLFCLLYQKNTDKSIEFWGSEKDHLEHIFCFKGKLQFFAFRSERQVLSQGLMHQRSDGHIPLPGICPIIIN